MWFRSSQRSACVGVLTVLCSVFLLENRASDREEQVLEKQQLLDLYGEFCSAFGTSCLAPVHVSSCSPALVPVTSRSSLLLLGKQRFLVLVRYQVPVVFRSSSSPRVLIICFSGSRDQTTAEPQYYSNTVLQYHSYTVLLYCSTAVVQYCCITVIQYHRKCTTILQYNCTQYYNTTVHIQQCEHGLMRLPPCVM